MGEMVRGALVSRAWSRIRGLSQSASSDLAESLCLPPALGSDVVGDDACFSLCNTDGSGGGVDVRRGLVSPGPGTERDRTRL